MHMYNCLAERRVVDCNDSPFVRTNTSLPLLSRDLLPPRNMASRYQTAVFGQLVRWMSRGKAFRYPDEIDASLWEKAATPDASRASSDEEAQDGSPGGSDVLVVGWYGPGDPEVRAPRPVGPRYNFTPTDPMAQNPQNWSPGVKHSITFQMCMLNFAVYIASSIYTPGEPFLMSDFHVGQEVATLGLSLFTL